MIALVVGGSGGIGRDICRRLADDGCTVIVGFASRQERADAVVADMGGAPHRTMHVDATNTRQLQEVAQALAEQDGRLDVLVNCAGVTRPVDHADLDSLDDELIDWIFTVNWRGPFATIRAVRSLLEEAPAPVVVNISSVAAVTGIGSNVAYCASKAALDSMTRSLGRSLGPTIRVVSVSPGWVEGEYAASLPAGVLDKQRGAAPLQALATGPDVAAAVSAAVHHLPMTTGAIIPVDGGRPLGV